MSSNTDGGHTGIAGSVGGSGGQISLAVGSLEGATRGGHVGTVGFTGSAGGTSSGSSTGSTCPGTVWAHAGVVFCMGSAGLSSVSSAATASPVGGTVSAQEGVGFCIGSAGVGSAVPGGVDAAGSTRGLDVAASALGVPSPMTSGEPVSSGSSGSVCGSNAGVTSGSSSSSAVEAIAAFSLAFGINGLVSRGGTTGAV